MEWCGEYSSQEKLTICKVKIVQLFNKSTPMKHNPLPSRFMMAMSLESVKKIQISHTFIRDFSLTNESYEVPNSKAHSYSLFIFF